MTNVVVGVDSCEHIFVVNDVFEVICCPFDLLMDWT